MDYKVTSLFIAVWLLGWQFMMWKKIKLKKWQDYTISALAGVLLVWFVYLSFL